MNHELPGVGIHSLPLQAKSAPAPGGAEHRRKKEGGLELSCDVSPPLSPSCHIASITLAAEPPNEGLNED